jgi:crotonobetainyl-CoA:carnitine CoA-transferase CaiB-like acyl-CoA transferase
MRLLAPYRVLDLTSPLGYSCGKILADLGADVVKIEPPGGDPARSAPPLLQSATGMHQSLFWLAFNANKRGVTLDLERREGQSLFLRMLERADFLLESFAPGTLGKWGFGYDQLKVQNRGLILVSISPYGQQGPYRNFQGSDIEIMALSGAMSLAGEKDGEPMRVSVPQAAMWVGAEAAMGALTALAYRSLTGKGQHVDVSAQAAVMAALAHAPVFWDLNRVNPEREGIFLRGRSVKGARLRVLWPCKDGWINFIIYGGAAGRRSNRQLIVWMSESGAAPESLRQMDWSQFDIATVSQDEVDRLEAPIARFLSQLTKQEFYEGAVKWEILGYPVFTAEDNFRDPQLMARQFWSDVRDPQSGATLKYPGGFALVNGERLAIRRPAPGVGEHSEEFYSQEIGLSAAEMKQFKATGII